MAAACAQHTTAGTTYARLPMPKGTQRAFVTVRAGGFLSGSIPWKEPFAICGAQSLTESMGLLMRKENRLRTSATIRDESFAKGRLMAENAALNATRLDDAPQLPTETAIRLNSGVIVPDESWTNCYRMGQ